MSRKLPKKQEVIRRTAVYSATSLIIVAIATFLVFLILGYRLDTKNGQIEQNALVQFDSSPTGATVSIDDVVLGSSTGTKANVSPSDHHFTFKKDGYETWNKDLNTLSGTLYWLDYAILIPKVRTPENVLSYTQLETSLTSPKSRYILVHKTPADINFDLVDIKNDNVTSKTVTIPASATTGLIGKKNLSFSIDSWDSSERYVLIRALKDSVSQWIVLDTKSPENSKNITTRLDIDFTSLKFYDTSGNIFYGLSSGDIRKIDLGAGTISRSIISKADSLSIFDAKWIFYTAKSTTNGTELPVAGIYRDGDDSATLVYSGSKAEDKLAITGANYRNKDYLAVAHGQATDVFIGTFPGFGDNFSEFMKLDASLSLTAPLTRLSFSQNADYLVAQTDSVFETYYLEHHLNYHNDLATAAPKLNWINNDYLWSDFGGNLTIREFDGANANNIMPVISGQDAALSSNAKYIYGFQKTSSGFLLSRVKLILN